SLGPVRWIVVTNSDHTRAAAALAAETGARTCGPAAEQATFPLRCARWLTEGDEVSDGIRVVALDGSKTPGELALIVDGSTLITGDLVRAHRAAALTCLPAAKLADRAAAVASIRRLAAIPGIEAVLVGDGWPVFERGGDHLRALAASLD
ncbi:MAG: MBL fold metallo-hydrolase, partial [Myxococcota bacterium]